MPRVWRVAHRGGMIAAILVMVAAADAVEPPTAESMAAG
jgi:hypothetical protein